MTLDVWACPYDLIGFTTDPLLYYYYAGDCPDDGQYWGITSLTPLITYGGCPDDPSTDPDCALVPTKGKPPSKQLPDGRWDTLIDRSTSPMKFHRMHPKNGTDPGATGLPRLAGPNLALTPNVKSGTTVIKAVNYQMVISNRRTAVRVFLLDVPARANRAHIKIGIGQEIDADPTGLPTFDDERQWTRPKWYVGYVSDGDLFYHIATKN